MGKQDPLNSKSNSRKTANKIGIFLSVVGIFGMIKSFSIPESSKKTWMILFSIIFILVGGYLSQLRSKNNGSQSQNNRKKK